MTKLDKIQMAVVCLKNCRYISTQKIKNIPTSLISVIIKGFYIDIEYFISIKYEMYTTKHYVCILSLYMYNCQRFLVNTSMTARSC